MSWRDQLRPARLGNASFEAENTEGVFGRNTQVHEYPLRDVPYVEDLGRRARRITIEAYVLSPRQSSSANVDNYMPARDALIAELESPGVKTLVHPYLGEMRVVVVEAAGPRESTREGGMARFTITVVEAGELRFPTSDLDTKSAVAEATDAALEQVEAEFAGSFDAQGFPAYVSEDARSLVDRVAEQLSDITRTVTTVPASVASFVVDLSALSGSASNLIQSPLTLARNVVSLISQLRTIATGPFESLSLLREMFDFGNDLPAFSTGTASRSTQLANQQAFTSLVQQAAVLEAVRAASQIEFESFDDALAVREELIEQLDAQAESTQNDDVYTAITDVRTAIARDIQERSADLARIIQVTLPESTPALVLAHRLYGDATRDADLIARNRLREPLFVPSGVELEVLSDA